MAKSKKKGNKAGYFLVFMIFLISGVALGVFGTLKYLEEKAGNDNTGTKEEGPVDITTDEKYEELIVELKNMLGEHTMFYSTKGVIASEIDNTSRLRLVYHYVSSKNLGVTEQLQPDYIGATTCNNGMFLVENNICNVTRYSIDLFTEHVTTLFNDQLLDTSLPFYVNGELRCVVNNSAYLCGKVKNILAYTGVMEPRFEVVKATKDVDSTIVIYDKGYLIDNRSTVKRPNSVYDNYYLHSSDSKDYYYELKSADNLTFKHTYKTLDKGKTYYYVSTELVPKDIKE